MSGTLGRLTRITDLRGQWPGEASHFTPWLAEEDNIALLGDTLGIEMEVEAVEQSVGPFRADILAKDTATNGWVLIENQLERTDHTHLGQLMTYAAGLEAVTIIWIAAKVAPDHRKAMDWLNEITDETFRFFALEIELWRIGDSVAAPKFNVICQPNDWQKSAVQARKAVEEGSLSPLRLKQRDYWAAVEARLAKRGSLNPISPPASSWCTRGLSKTGTALSMAMNTQANWLRVEIWLSGAFAQEDFQHLLPKAQAATAQSRLPIIWGALPERKSARICLARTEMTANPLDKPDHPRQHEWLVSTAEKLDEVFRPLIAQLDRNAEPDDRHAPD